MSSQGGVYLNFVGFRFWFLVQFLVFLRGDFGVVF
jgi:hypothetical protein